MSEVIGTPGAAAEVGGQYSCSECGHRITVAAGETLPPAHHPEKPWTLMVRDS